MLVSEASNLGVSENRFEPTASCVNDIYVISNTCVVSRLMSSRKCQRSLFCAISAQSLQMS